MPVLRFSYSLDVKDPLDVIASARDALAPGSPALRQAYTDAGVASLDYFRRRFIRNSSGGGDWPKLKPSTIRSKGGNPTILVRNGKLVKSLLRGASGNVFSVQPDRVRVGTSVPYSVYHQSGTQRMARRTIIVKPDASSLREILTAFAQGLLTSLRTAMRSRKAA